jgi:hypothetical protein
MVKSTYSENGSGALLVNIKSLHVNSYNGYLTGTSSLRFGVVAGESGRTDDGFESIALFEPFTLKDAKLDVSTFSSVYINSNVTQTVKSITFILMQGNQTLNSNSIICNETISTYTLNYETFLKAVTYNSTHQLIVKVLTSDDFVTFGDNSILLIKVYPKYDKVFV